MGVCVGKGGSQQTQRSLAGKGVAELALDTRHPDARADAPPNDTPVEPAPEAQGPERRQWAPGLGCLLWKKQVIFCVRTEAPRRQGFILHGKELSRKERCSEMDFLSKV